MKNRKMDTMNVISMGKNEVQYAVQKTSGTRLFVNVLWLQCGGSKHYMWELSTHPDQMVNLYNLAMIVF